MQQLYNQAMLYFTTYLSFCDNNIHLRSRNSLHLIPELANNVVNKVEKMQLSLEPTTAFYQ